MAPSIHMYNITKSEGAMDLFGGETLHCMYMYIAIITVFIRIEATPRIVAALE